MQSDSSSESGSESGTVGQGTSAEVLQALENLTQKVEELNGKVDKSESSLVDLKNQFSNFSSSSSKSNFEFTDPVATEFRKSGTVIEVPNGAILMLRGPIWTASSGTANFTYAITLNNGHIHNSTVSNCEEGNIIPLQPETKSVTLYDTRDGQKNFTTYCFLVDKR